MLEFLDERDDRNRPKTRVIRRTPAHMPDVPQFARRSFRWGSTAGNLTQILVDVKFRDEGYARVALGTRQELGFDIGNIPRLSRD